VAKVAIHQPNFMPWMGLFHRLARVDRFVIFDHVQAMGGRSWLSRNRVLIQGSAHWLTLPVHKAGRLGQAVNEVEIDYQRDIVRKHLRTLELAYVKCPHGPVFLEMATTLYQAGHRYISEFNTAFIQEVCRRLGFNVEFVYSSALVTKDAGLVGLAGNDLVLQVCHAAGASEYISGDGCTDFIKPQTFEASGVKFAFQNFKPPAYTQRGATDHVSHLSIFDALCNIGAEEMRRLIEVPASDHPVGREISAAS
jgi:hypothetical protein